MRVSGFRIRNFKGIKFAECSGISGEPLVLISGKNGTGKSLILESLALVYNSRWLSPAGTVGPYGPVADVQIEIKLSDIEQEDLNSWTTANSSPGISLLESLELVIHQQFNSAGQVLTGEKHSPLSEVLRNPEFRKVHPWARLEFLPSVRLLPGGQSSAVDPGILDPGRMMQERDSSLDGYLQGRQPANLSNVFTYLATTDYVDLMAMRDGEAPTGEFDSLVTPFEEATGKKISRPKPQADFSIKMQVQLPSGGISHPISELSSGEQELMAISYFVSRAKAAGGVLLIDEPEQHLHPTLQSAILRQVSQLSSNAQVLAVTHSVNILSTTSTSAIMTMSESPGGGLSQLTPLVDDGGRIDLIAQLGLTAADLVQAENIVIVEGETDESLLRLLYPAETARSAFVVAGDVHGVMKICAALEKVDQVLPYICLRDRDFLDDEGRTDLMNKHRGLHIWENRMIENELLDAGLLLETFRRAGSTISLPEMRRLLAGLLVEGDKLEAKLAAIDGRLRKVKPDTVEIESDAPKGVARHRRYYEDLAAASIERVARFDQIERDVDRDIDDRWAADWLKLVDGKKILDRLKRPSPVKDLRAALAAAYLAAADARPIGLVKFGEKLRALKARKT